MTDQPRVEAIVGVVGRPHGVRGDVHVELRTDEPERRFAKGSALRVEGRRGTIVVDASRWHQDRFLVRFVEFPDRTAVETLRGAVLLVDVAPDELPSDEGEYYDRQLVGLEVVVGGVTVGTLASIMHLPAQDVLVIDTDNGERLVPFVEQLVPEVDLAAGRVVLADVPGLLTDEGADE